MPFANIQVIVLAGAGASVGTDMTVDGESAYRHYSPLLEQFALNGVTIVKVFTSNHDSTIESISESGDSEWIIQTDWSKTETGHQPVIYLCKLNETNNYYGVLRKTCAYSRKTICIAIGYSFRDKKVADIVGEAVDNGMRLLVIDKTLQYLQLANRLGIANVKHKVRIEEMEFGDWNDEKKLLLAAIVSDEFRRLLD